MRSTTSPSGPPRRELTEPAAAPPPGTFRPSHGAPPFLVSVVATTIAGTGRCVVTARGQFAYRLMGIAGLRPTAGGHLQRFRFLSPPRLLPPRGKTPRSAPRTEVCS